MPSQHKKIHPANFTAKISSKFSKLSFKSQTRVFKIFLETLKKPLITARILFKKNLLSRITCWSLPFFSSSSWDNVKKVMLWVLLSLDYADVLLDL